MTQIKGITAKFPGHCGICGGDWSEGDIIDKGADGKRGHAQCVARVKQTAAPQQAVQPQQIAQPAVAASAPTATKGPRAASVTAVIDDHAITALWQLKSAMTMIAQGAMAAAVAIEQIATIVDPHQAKASRAERADKDAA